MLDKILNFSDFFELNENNKPKPSLIGKALSLGADIKDQSSKSTIDKSTVSKKGDSGFAKTFGEIKGIDLFFATEIGQNILNAVSGNEELYSLWQKEGILPKNLEDTPFTVEELENLNKGKSKEVEKNKENIEKLGGGKSEKPNFGQVTASSNYKFGDYQNLDWDDLKQILEKSDYADELDFDDYNLVAIRNFVNIKKQYSNKFTDLLVLMSPSENKEVQYFPATTVPGETFLLQTTRNWYIANGDAGSINPKGLAIVQPGVYKYKIGKHKGKYEALVQDGKVKINRFTPVDSISKAKFTTYSPGNPETGKFGINIHRGNRTGVTDSVNDHSAGCFVFQNADDLKTLLALMKKNKQSKINVSVVELDEIGKNFLASLSKKEKSKSSSDKKA